MTRTDGTKLLEIARVFLKLGALSYGGPAIMGIMQAELQEKRRWLSKERFLEGMGLIGMLPGPAATQLGIFIGYDRAGWRGGLLAGLCFMLPAFAILMTLTLLYAAYGTLELARHALYGIGPVVLGIFMVAVWRLGKAGIKLRWQAAVALAAAAAAAFTGLGIATILLFAGCAGVFVQHSRARGAVAAAAVGLLAGAAALLPLVGTSAATGSESPGLAALGLFFLKVGAFTFGGGITLLAFIQDQVVNQLGWLTPQEYLDGLAIGQLTPGPIVMLAAFIGFKLAGFAGAVVSVVAIFLPAFVLMLAILPVLARFKSLAWIKAAMSGIAGGVIGVLAVSLAKLMPHAAPDAFTFALLAATVAGMLLWRPGPLPLMAGGALAGVAYRLRIWQKLRELA